MEMQQLRYVVVVARREATETKDLLRGTVAIGVLPKPSSAATNHRPLAQAASV